MGRRNGEAVSTSRIHLVNRFEHPENCRCDPCALTRFKRVLDAIDARNSRLRTVNEIIAELAVFTDEQRSLAWSPEPPWELTGGSDCRPGGSCGLDFNSDTRHARWLKAHARMVVELRRQQRAANRA